MQPYHTQAVRVLGLGIGLLVCGWLVVFTASLSSMRDMHTSLTNRGEGLLCQLGRQSIQTVDTPNCPASSSCCNRRNSIQPDSLLPSRISSDCLVWSIRRSVLRLVYSRFRFPVFDTSFAFAAPQTRHDCQSRLAYK